MGQLAIIDVDGADEQFLGLGILNGQVTESANARDSDPFARLRRSLLDPLVSRDSSTPDSAGFGFDQNLAWPGSGDVPFQKRQGFSELLDNCGVHLERHG